MIGVVLETSAQFPTGVHEWFLFGADVLSAILGLAIAYIAYRGYQRNQSRPMLYISIGFVLVLGIPFAGLLAFLAVPFATELAVATVTQVSQVVGLLVILYGLRVPT